MGDAPDRGTRGRPLRGVHQDSPQCGGRCRRDAPVTPIPDSRRRQAGHARAVGTPYADPTASQHARTSRSSCFGGPHRDRCRRGGDRTGPRARRQRAARAAQPGRPDVLLGAPFRAQRADHRRSPICRSQLGTRPTTSRREVRRRHHQRRRAGDVVGRVAPLPDRARRPSHATPGGDGPGVTAQRQDPPRADRGPERGGRQRDRHSHVQPRHRPRRPRRPARDGATVDGRRQGRPARDEYRASDRPQRARFRSAGPRYALRSPRAGTAAVQHRHLQRAGPERPALLERLPPSTRCRSRSTAKRSTSPAPAPITRSRSDSPAAAAPSRTWSRSSATSTTNWPRSRPRSGSDRRTYSQATPSPSLSIAAR